MHTQHPYWALALISIALLTICGSAGLGFWALQKREDWLTARTDRKTAQLEHQHRQQETRA